MLENRVFQKLYQRGKMTLGFSIPTERMSKMPRIENQLELAHQIEDFGFAALWLRDVTMQDLTIDDNGQMFDVWIYLTYLAANTERIALGTSSVVLPLRHPVRVAKEALSIHRLFPDRLILGVGSGDRGKDFTALGIEKEKSGHLFKENFEIVDRLLKEESPTVHSDQGFINGTNTRLIPQAKSPIPLMATGFSRQSMEWIAEHGDGWFQYPRSFQQQTMLIRDYRAMVEEKCPGVFKPFTQSLFIDLAENPEQSPVSIPLGFRVGRKYLLELLHQFQEIGVNHLSFVLYFSKRPPADVIQELGEEILPYFPKHSIDNE